MMCCYKHLHTHLDPDPGQLALDLLDGELRHLVRRGQLRARRPRLLAEQLRGELPVHLALGLAPVRPLAGRRVRP